MPCTLRVFGRNRGVIDEAQRRAVRAVGLAEAIILVRDSAIIIERGAPEHGAVIHHAVIDIAHDLAVTKAAGSAPRRADRPGS